jgi:hypothetical protein
MPKITSLPKLKKFFVMVKNNNSSPVSKEMGL